MTDAERTARSEQLDQAGLIVHRASPLGPTPWVVMTDEGEMIDEDGQFETEGEALAWGCGYIAGRDSK